jgi:hypothetical protein
MGIIFNYRDSWIPILFVGFLLSEITSISLKAQRVKQVEISSFYSETRLATLAIVSGNLTSAMLIPSFISLIQHFGLSFAFVFISCFFLVGALLMGAIKRNEKVLLAMVLLCFFGFNVKVGSTELFTYETVMLDRPRLVLELGQNTASEDERFIMNNVHCGLFKATIDKGVEAELAASWDIEDGGTKYRIRIRRGVFDNNGTEIDAKYVLESIRASLQFTVDHQVNGLPFPGELQGYKDLVGFEKCGKNSCEIDGLRIEKNELIFQLKKKMPKFIDLLTRQMLPIYRLRSSGPGVELPVTCGLYNVVEYSVDHMVLKKSFNNNIETKKSPDTFRIDFRNSEKAVSGFCQGKYNDLVFLVPTPDDLKKAGCSGKSYLWKEIDTAGYWAINLGSRSLLKKEKLFSALTKSLNVSSFQQKWKIDSKVQISSIPNFFGPPKDSLSPFKQLQGTDVNVIANFDKIVRVRYIEGTPNPVGLRLAVSEWMNRNKLKYEIIATPFTEFTKDLTSGNSEIYIYAELATTKLENFLKPFYELNRNLLGPKEREQLNKIWAEYLNSNSRTALAELDRINLKSMRFIPLYVFRRPLVFKRGFYVRRHSPLGLAALPISEFRKGIPE